MDKDVFYAQMGVMVSEIISGCIELMGINTSDLYSTSGPDVLNIENLEIKRIGKCFYVTHRNGLYVRLERFKKNEVSVSRDFDTELAYFLKLIQTTSQHRIFCRFLKHGGRKQT